MEFVATVAADKDIRSSFVLSSPSSSSSSTCFYFISHEHETSRSGGREMLRVTQRNICPLVSIDYKSQCHVVFTIAGSYTGCWMHHRSKPNYYLFTWNEQRYTTIKVFCFTSSSFCVAPISRQLIHFISQTTLIYLFDGSCAIFDARIFCVCEIFPFIVRHYSFRQ